MKRYIYIIIGIIVAAVIAILIILFIKNRSSNGPIISTNTTGSLPAVGTQTNPNATQSSSGQNNLPSVISLGFPASSSTTPNGQSSIKSFGILSNSPVLDYFVDAQNDITAVQPNGSIITISNGQSSVINSSTINNIISASFSFDGKKILVSFGNPTNPQAAIFDIKSQIWTALHNGLFSPQWSPASGYQIAYLENAGVGKLSLSMINAGNLKSGIATLLTLHANDMDLQWPTKNQFILSDKPSINNNGSIWSFNSQTNSLVPIAVEEAGVESIWSTGTAPTGLIFSNDPSGRNPSLSLENISGNMPAQQLNFLTLPSKCLFSPAKATVASSTNAATSSVYLALYCGVPRPSSNFASAYLPDDYNMMSLFTSDDIYRINTTNGNSQILWNDQTQSIDTSDMKIFNGNLFFINRYNQELYGLVLK